MFFSFPNNEWKIRLSSEFEKKYFQALEQIVQNEYQSQIVYPKYNQIFSAFEITDFSDVSVVILGQDPYYNEGQANGLAFSVCKNQPIPKSLKNIFSEIKSDVNIDVSSHGDLTNWAKQGVLLLNTVLTVRKGEPNSHRMLGWERFTDSVISSLNKHPKRLVFMLWGNNAISKSKLIDGEKHLILKAPHPSPLSAYRGFFGCKHFSKTNQFLLSQGNRSINWEV